jgi:membrane fusion protein, multidrug efflux system
MRTLTLLMIAVLAFGGMAVVAYAEEAPSRIRALVVPLQHAKLSSRLQATIERIGPETGESFKAGDTLVLFDCEAYRAELDRASADTEAATASLAVKRELVSKGAASRLQVQLAEAELKRSKAQRSVASKQVDDCQIVAPFDGRVVERIANAHETVGARDPLLEIVSEHDLELRAFVPSLQLRSVDPGKLIQFTVDETGDLMEARVIAVGARIDNVSQLIEVRAAFTSTYAKLIPGMSGSVRLPTTLAGAAGAP